MGTDISAFLEYKATGLKGESEWICFASDIWLSRPYLLFSLMSGVRHHAEPIFPARGIPEDVSQRVLWKYCYYVHENQSAHAWYMAKYCTPKEAEDYVKRGMSEWVGKDENKIRDPQWKKTSWLNVYELERVHQRFIGDVGNPLSTFQAVIDAMYALNEGDVEQTRLVFWFDSD
jgi:hypothetical protein